MALKGIKKINAVITTKAHANLLKFQSANGMRNMDEALTRILENL